MESLPHNALTMTPQRATATRFILSLPIVNKANLPDEHKSCHICMEDFKAQTANTLELPVRLPCSHILGTICMINWLSSNGDESPRGCPMCRAELLPQAQPPPPPLGVRSRRREISNLRRIRPFDEVAPQRIVDLGRESFPWQRLVFPPVPPAPQPSPISRAGVQAFDEVDYQRVVDLGRVSWPRRGGYLPPGPPTSRPRPVPRPGHLAPSG